MSERWKIASAWAIRSEWLRDHPDAEVVIDEGEALWMREQALLRMEAHKQAERAT